MKKDNRFKEKTNQMDRLLLQMHFACLANGKKYSFDYQYKEDFEKINEELKQLLDREEKLPRSITSRMPIFLPRETSRITFFNSQAKSAKRIDATSVIEILSGINFGYKPKADESRSIKEILADDLKIFNGFNRQYSVNEYYIDTFSTSVRFNAYDDEDNMLVEKSYVLGGLVFDTDAKYFSDKIAIDYPRHRKQRSDIKTNYLGLATFNIRPIENIYK